MKVEIRAAIGKMKSGKEAGPVIISLKLLEALKTIELMRPQHYSTKNIAQVRFHQTFPNLYFWHGPKKGGASV